MCPLGMIGQRRPSSSLLANCPGALHGTADSQGAANPWNLLVQSGKDLCPDGNILV